jgi:predicted 3-demethylubiquinone-9 3-methyltransferase (glyoxalase superfamily)
VPITTCLWFDGNADEAVDFYLSVFPGSRRLSSFDATSDMPQEKGSTVVVDFELLGTQFMALNGGPEYQFTPAVSFVIPCKDQAEVDNYWDQLTKGGKEIQCGWCIDRFGVAWQVVPDRLQELLGDPDEGRAYRAMQAMLQMVKLDIAQLEAAADGR